MSSSEGTAKRRKAPGTSRSVNSTASVGGASHGSSGGSNGATAAAVSMLDNHSNHSVSENSSNNNNNNTNQQANRGTTTKKNTSKTATSSSNSKPTTKSAVTHHSHKASLILNDLQREHAAIRATVRRNFLGTGPFDRHWLNLDCCGLFCAAITYGLHMFGTYAVTMVLLPPWMSYYIHVEGSQESSDGGAAGAGADAATETTRIMTSAGLFHQAAFAIIAGLACISHFQAMITDPGAVPPDAKPVPVLPDDHSGDLSDVVAAASETTTTNDTTMTTVPPPLPPPRPPQNLRLCRRCKAYKPPRAHHCSICKRCIIKMDHHCPWVNNCVGIGNHKYFLLFVFYTFCSCAYAMLLVIVRFSSCVHNTRYHFRAGHRHGGHGHHAVVQAAAAAATAAAAAAEQQRGSCVDQPSQLLTILLLLIESLLFGIFTSCMMFDQMEVVQNKMTHIDRLKGVQVGGSLEGIAEVFGTTTEMVKGKKRKRRHGGSGFRLDWLSPFVHGACFPASIRDEVMGFCLPSSMGGGGGCCSNGDCADDDNKKNSNKRSNVEDIV